MRPSWGIFRTPSSLKAAVWPRSQGSRPYPLPNQPDGTLRLEDIRAAIRSKGNPHYPISRLLILENTHNRCGGSPLSLEYTRQAGELAHAHGLSFHIDGARIFNAAAALGVSAATLAAPADSITFCLSKGLCAPVGSVLCGSADFITRAWRFRKMLGGGWRQAGRAGCGRDRRAGKNDRAARGGSHPRQNPGKRPGGDPRPGAALSRSAYPTWSLPVSRRDAR